MEALNAAITSGTLQQLGELEERMRRDFGALQERSELNRKLQRLEELKGRVKELKELKSQLERQLRHFPTDTLRARLLQNLSVDGVTATSLSPDLQQELLEKAAKLDQVRQLEYELVAHRCAGITASMVNKRKVRVRFDTCYKGEYFEPFYLQLTFGPHAVESSWHTIPFFIPLDSLLKQYNSREIKFANLLDTVHSYLMAYITRRQQTEEVMEGYSHLLSENISSFKAYNFIQLTLSLSTRGQTHVVVVHLIYKDLCSTLPNKVRCSDPGSLGLSRAAIKQIFLSCPPAEALQTLQQSLQRHQNAHTP